MPRWLGTEEKLISQNKVKELILFMPFLVRGKGNHMKFYILD